jgi:hypothetical protein
VTVRARCQPYTKKPSPDQVERGAGLAPLGRLIRSPRRGTTHNPRAEVGPPRVCGMERASALLASWTSTTQKNPRADPLGRTTI